MMLQIIWAFMSPGPTRILTRYDHISVATYVR